MNIWSGEIKDLVLIYKSLKGNLPDLEKELGKLVTTTDENMLLVYSRRCLEVIITELCENKLKRDRGTEPLLRIIDKLNKEKIVPHNIIVSMQNVNSMSTFGAHPKEFEIQQIKPVLSNLAIIVRWYIRFSDLAVNDKILSRLHKPGFYALSGKSLKKRILLPVVILAAAIFLSILVWKDVIKIDRQTGTNIIKSIAVLPFDNYTGDDSLEYFVSGMHSSLIGDMGRFGELRVIGKTSSSIYKNSDMPVPEIGKELNVDAVVEATVMCLGDSICLQVRILSTYPEEKQIWIADYKEDRSKILNMYNQITKQIANEISIEITPQEMKLLSDMKMVNREAYDAYLKGEYYWEKLDPESMQKALDFFELATQLEPEWADPYAGLANAWGIFGMFEILPESVTIPEKNKYINKALELNPNSAKAHYVKALNAVWTEWDWEQGEKEFIKALELNPNDALAHLYYAHLLMIMHRNEEAVYQANLGLELDPLKPLILSLYAIVMQNEGNYKSSLSYLNKALSIDPEFGFATGNLLPALFNEGEYEKWIEAWEKKVRAGGRWKDEAITNVVNAFHEQGHIAAIEEMFKMNEKYGDGAYMSDEIKITRYLELNDFEKAIDYLEKYSDVRNLDATYLGTNLNKFDQLKEYPEYIELLKKMELPLPEN